MKVFYILLCILSCLSAEASPAASRQHLDLGLFVKSLSVGTQQKLLSNDGYLSSTQGATRGWTAKERAASVNSEFAKRQHICALAEKHDLSCDDVVFTSAKIYLTQGIANPLYVVSLMKSEEEEIGFPSTFPKNCGVSNPSIDFSASVYLFGKFHRIHLASECVGPIQVYLKSIGWFELKREYGCVIRRMSSHYPKLLERLKAVCQFAVFQGGNSALEPIMVPSGLRRVDPD